MNDLGEKRDADDEVNSPQGSRIAFDDSSVEKLFSDPGRVLQDTQSFWQNEVPYRATVQWSESTRVPIDYENFKTVLAQLKGQTPEERKRHAAYVLSRKVMESAPAFMSTALPHVLSYVPTGTRINTVVRTACFIPPWAYVSEDSVIINTSHKHWNNDLGMVLNIIIHELFHMGFGQYIEPIDFSKIKTPRQIGDLILMGLQSEGMATYVAYRARGLFPSSTVDPDYAMLDNKEQVRAMTARINGLLELSKSESFENMRDAIWEVGSKSRCYYVVGAHMASRIEDVLGREALIETIPRRVRYFVDTHNALALEDFWISY